MPIYSFILTVNTESPDVIDAVTEGALRIANQLAEFEYTVDLYDGNGRQVTGYYFNPADFADIENEG